MALKTKDYSVSGTSSGGGITYTYILRVTENSVDTDTNTSNVTVKAILKSSYSGTAFSNYGLTVSCTINGSQKFSDYAQRSCSGTSEQVYYTWTGDLAHNADGTLSITVGGKLVMASSASYTPPTLTITESSSNAMTLTAITVTPTTGFVYIDNGSSFDAYEVYIDNGSSWDKYSPYIDNGSSWDIYN